ncbi:cbb3-type cytochrome c oxidase N-terminal domain-containing protein [Pedobacter montanisoli]|uniref:C-type cytochrome n=1 Tax=Pedobacter montanisoli TaxID=2923277 RepID=A0ABS9ZZJ8_9SPHI|nr:cbb3-type cytochrome c oxidase N-terminal domain-containing protein [Pedobacter montanisoli]MCJ0743740.1 c-type cytochrome [Pedobacter montanisoli]
MNRIKFSILFLFIGFSAFAQTSAEVPEAAASAGWSLSITEILVIVALIFAALSLWVTIILYRTFKLIYEEQKNPKPYHIAEKVQKLEYDEWKKQQKKTLSVWDKLLSLKPIEQEKDLEIPHSYDGIKELNNPIPAWFNILFYGTLIFAAGYLYYYHVGGYGQRQDDEYATEMAKADEEKRKFLAKSATSVDENTVKVDESQIAVGKGLFDANCVACHGEHGEGLVGPNLTDEYWLHGGSIKDIFKSIKYGIPEKGMVSWEKNMSSANISAVANYILSLQGTKPANAKAPQGVKYEPEQEATAEPDPKN